MNSICLIDRHETKMPALKIIMSSIIVTVVLFSKLAVNKLAVLSHIVL